MAQARMMVRAYDPTQRISLESLAETAGVHEELIYRFMDYGLLEPAEQRESLVLFEVSAVTRLRAIQRLRHDLGVNLPGIGVILELLERNRRLERELYWLRRR